MKGIKKRTVCIMLILSMVLPSVNVNAKPAYVKSENVIEVLENCPELQYTLENSKVNLDNKRQGIVKTYVKQKAIKWALNHLESLIDLVAPFISSKNAQKLYNSVNSIKNVLNTYQDCKNVLKTTIVNKLSEALSGTFSGGTSKIIASFLADSISSKDEGGKNPVKKNYYIIAYSSTRKLKKSDLKGMSMRELRLARNEIYARHGRKFLDSDLQKYFNHQKWYNGYIEPEDFIDENEMTKLEIKNAKFILAYEKKKQ